jgi:predicted NUDIX family phosphoesterase
MPEQQVLVASRQALVGAGLTAGFIPLSSSLPIVEEIYRSGEFIPRSLAERDPTFLQPIPCGLIHCDHRILTLERQEKNKRHSLNGRLALWAGGHVDVDDALSPSEDLLRSSLERELGEELDVVTGRPEFQGIIYDGRSLHFAVVYDVPAMEPAGRAASNDEFRIGKRTSPSGRFVPLEELERRFNQLEAWSKLILTELLLRRHVLSPSDSSLQLSLDLGQRWNLAFRRSNGQEASAIGNLPSPTPLPSPRRP